MTSKRKQKHTHTHILVIVELMALFLSSPSLQLFFFCGFILSVCINKISGKRAVSVDGDIPEKKNTWKNVSTQRYTILLVENVYPTQNGYVSPKITHTHTHTKKTIEKNMALSVYILIRGNKRRWKTAERATSSIDQTNTYKKYTQKRVAKSRT